MNIEPAVASARAGVYVLAKRKKILLTNDDGYFSDGLVALNRALSRAHDVFVVAPDREQSASSHSLTLNRPLRIHKIGKHTYSTDGTPTDCVMLALHRIFKSKKPDLVISGINHGANMGDDIIYSGTVAAAVEGSISRIPSIAVSMVGWEPGMKMSAAASFVTKFVGNLERLDIDYKTIININFPPHLKSNKSRNPYREYEFTSQGFRRYRDIIIAKKDPRRQPYYWIGGRPQWRKTNGTDFAVVSRGIVSITPLKLEFTDGKTLDRVKKADLKI